MSDGFVNFLKPPGMTSSDAVLLIRKSLPRGVKVGHGGTLDPDAAGVLPVCVGRAVRLFDYIVDKEKVYIAEIALGVATDTQDASGRILEKRPVNAGAAELCAVLPRFTGEIMQTPPMYSALKRDGKKLCDLARRGEEIQILPRPVRVLALDYLGESGYNRHMIRVRCQKGVYVRTLMHDIGQTLGCGGHMSFLLRAQAGVFKAEDAVTVQDIAGQGAEAFLRPMDEPLSHYPRLDYGEALRQAAGNGNPLPDTQALAEGTLVRVYVGGVFAGMACADGAGLIRFKAMLL